jgi:hypothetical protein
VETEDASVEALGPGGFPLWLSFSFGKAPLGSLINTGAEFDEFSIVATYNKQNSVYVSIDIIKKKIGAARLRMMTIFCSN